MKKITKQLIPAEIYKIGNSCRHIVLLLFIAGSLSFDCEGQTIQISSNGQTGAIDCAASVIHVQVDNPNPNYNYTWHYIFLDVPTCSFDDSNIIGTGTDIWVPTNVGYFFAITCIADTGGMIWDASQWLKVRRADLKAPVGVLGTSPCGEMYMCAQSIFYITSSNTYVNMQWFKNGVPVNLGLDPTSVTLSSSGTYYLRAQVGNCGFAYSDTFNVTVNKPSATITPSGSTTFCSGGSVTLNAPVAANRTYQWKKNGTNISGATFSNYVATASGTYKVTVTNTLTGCSKTTATGTVVTKNPIPAATITPSGTITFCAGQSALLTANSGTGYTYKWKKNGSYISGATAMTYTVTTAGNYRVEVTNSYGCTKTSAADTVVVPCREGENVTAGNNFDVNVYPNPSSDDFMFEISNPTDEIISIKIFDVIGKLVLGETNMDEQFTIHNSQLVSGIYSAVITVGENKKTLKIVKTE